jgi:hypothetical protein
MRCDFPARTEMVRIRVFLVDFFEKQVWAGLRGAVGLAMALMVVHGPGNNINNGLHYG